MSSHYNSGGNISLFLENTLKVLQGDGPLSSGNRDSLRTHIQAVAFLVIVASGICWVNYRLHFNGFVLNDYHEYCQIARNFYEGNGYSTSVLRPLAYQFFQTLPQPEVTRMPVYPLFLSVFFHLFGPSDNTIVLFNSLCFVGLTSLIYFVAFELSRDYLLSLLAALLTASMHSFISYTLTAEPNIFYAAMIAAFFYFYLKYPEKMLVHGIFLGLLYTLRANTLFVIMGFWVGLILSSYAWKRKVTLSLLLGSGFMLGLVPYMIRNYLVVGKPFFSLYQYSLLLFTAKFPQYTIWTMISDINPIQHALSHPGEMLAKSYNFLISLLDTAVPFYHPFVLILVSIGFFLSTGDTRLKSMRTIIISGMLIQTALVLPIGPVPYYYMFFFPLMITVALINAKKHLRSYMLAAGLLSLAIFLYTTIPYWKSPKPVNPYILIGKQISEMTDKDDIILTDMPWEITWYANRRTVWLPYDLETLGKISRTLKPKYVLLTGNSYAAYKDNVWNHMIQDRSYARSIGYEFSSTIQFQNNVIGLLYKSGE